MSWETQAWVWVQPNMTANDKLVALAFGNHGDEYGYHLRPGVNRICHLTGLSESTVKRSIKSLLESGILILVKEAEGRGSVNEYRMPVDLDVVAAHYKNGIRMLQNNEKKGVQNSKGVQVGEKRGSNEAEKGVHSDLQDSNNKLSGNIDSCDSRFEAFWKAYPARVGDNGVGKKIGKDAARQQFHLALKHVTFDELMAAVAVHAQSTDARYVKDAHRWLKGKGWQDDTLPGIAPLHGPQNGGNGHVRISANAPPEAWLPLADKMGVGDDKSSHPEIGGAFIDLYAQEICAIVGFDPNEPRGDWHVLAEWMREGLCDERAATWNEYLIPELKRLCARPGYKPPGGLAYFSKPLHEGWR